ncbi:hypothetical protein F5Y11DRAFT_315801 [Daldinia sp. FL1419]|nr:hypothetical protein F5Y11DRAFT_315801 [Daldinia sp. FL1419]
MLLLLQWSGLDFFYHIILVVYLAILIFLDANHIRTLILTMADTMDPQTPPKKLFKPSSKTKTPTSSKKQMPTTPTHSSVQSHDILTPTETISRSTDALGSAPEATKATIDDLSKEEDDLNRTNNLVEAIVKKSQEIPNPSSDNLSEPSNPTDILNSPTDAAKYFAEQGNLEMNSFVSALAGESVHNQSNVASNSTGTPRANNSANENDGDLDNKVSGSITELPRDDTLVISPNERTKDMLEKTANDAANKIPSSKPSPEEDEVEHDGIVDEPTTRGINNKKSNLESNSVDEVPAYQFADVSKEAEGATNASEERAQSATPTNAIGEPNTNIISQGAHVSVSDETGQLRASAHGSSNKIERSAAPSASGVSNDGTQIADNMGQPAHIERRIEVPLPRPAKIVNNPSEPTRPNTNSIADSLGDPDELPDVQDLRSTDDLQDPPEEILDPCVHSPSSNVTPIPKIPKIAPIGMAPPTDLFRLADGLGGGVIDDVGNIIDESGKILGHATGDLPAMVGKKVADNGEIYGDGGEVIGYVSENFTGPPSPVDIPENVLGGLKVDHNGNILDANGNIIGCFNEKAGENGNLASFMKQSKPNGHQTEDKKNDERKPKVNAHTGGSPSDIFLDVKSTTDGIQLTIRIPTTFGRQPQDS